MKKMRGKTAVFFAAGLISALLLSACGGKDPVTESTVPFTKEAETTKEAPSGGEEDPGRPEGPETPEDPPAMKIENCPIDPEQLPAAPAAGTNTLKIAVESGTDHCWKLQNGKLIFSGLRADTVISISGEFSGEIVIDGGNDYQFELEMRGLTLASENGNPIQILSGDKVQLSAKKETVNYVLDLRGEQLESDENGAAIYSARDLIIGGKGSLAVSSACHNGILSKKDLKVQNLLLLIMADDYDLRGDDSVTVDGGTYYLAARQGDCLKTMNTDISSKGKQRGNVDIGPCEMNLFAAGDGVDAAHNVNVSENAMIRIATDRFSAYTKEAEKTDGEKRYIRFHSDQYHYSVLFYNSETDRQWVDAVFSADRSVGAETFYYYVFNDLPDYEKVRIFVYDQDQKSSQDQDYLVSSDYMQWNSAYDTCALNQRGSTITYSWTYYDRKPDDISGGNFPGGPGGNQTVPGRDNPGGPDGNQTVPGGDNPGGPGGNQTAPGGDNPGGPGSKQADPGRAGGNPPAGPGGFGPMEEGNQDKADHSAKGIKAANDITILGGLLEIWAGDDALHAGSGDVLENGKTPTGHVTVLGGSLILYSKDDAIHGDGTVTVNGGKLTVTYAFEGIEGNQVLLQGGALSFVTKDDGINATAKEKTGIRLSGGSLYLYSGGDAFDANSKDRYQGVVIEGGQAVVISTSHADASVDTEKGYTFSGGSFLAIGAAGGMAKEVTDCENFSEIGTQENLSLRSGDLLSVRVDNETAASVTLPCSLQAQVVYLGSNHAVFSVNEK